jgi:hypothetical protein
MATWGEMLREIVELHEKLNYDENSAIRARVLDAMNRALLNLWSKADWSFRVQQAEIEYDPDSDDNTLPENFLTFHHTGRVVALDSAGEPQFNLEYIPFNEMMRRLKASRSEYGNPEVYSLGGSITGTGNQRSIFVFPKPSSNLNLRLIYHSTAPQGSLDRLTEEIPSVPPNWHFVIKELAILFRLMDKSADTSVQAALVKTCLDGMMRDEPHGREDMPRMQPAYAWRMRMR